MVVDNAVPEQAPRSGWLQTLGIAAVGVVPAVGAPVAALISEGMRQRAREHDEAWFAMTNARLREIEQGGVPVNTEHPEFVAAIRRLAVAAGETADEEKRALLAAAAANSGPWSSAELEVREEYLALVIDLAPLYIRALAMVDARQEIPGPADGGTPALQFSQFANELGTDRPTAQRVMIALQQRGLFGTPISGGGTQIEITMFGAGLLRFLREHSTATT